MTTARYGDALQWAEQLHLGQRRKGKAIPYISQVISPSVLLWEDGGNADQAIAAMLHDGIEDASESHSSIAERFDVAVDDMVHDCTDTSPNTQPSEKTLVAAQIPLHHFLAGKSISLLLVTAADKAHNAREMVLDARRNPAMWRKFNAGLDGSAWYMPQIHQQLEDRLPNSRSVERLKEAVNEILSSSAYQALIPE